ncbi:MAG: AMP-binding protein, partial [Pyrinomonadaceae bacterium]
MIFRGPSPDVNIPDVPLTSFVMEHLDEVRDKTAFIEGPTGRVITYAQFAESISRVAASLAQRGFTKGEVFAILSPNVPEYAIAFHAVATLGGINTTVNPLYTSEEIADQLQDAGAKFMVTVPEFVEKARAAATKANTEELFVFGEAEGATPFAWLLESHGEPPQVKINPREDLVALPYSSGTTGMPKGVMLTHYNLVANLCQMDGLDFFHRDDTLIAVLPLFHIYGLMVILNMGIRMGATIVTMPRFDLEQFLRIVEKYDVTLAHLVPPIVLALTKSSAVDNHDLSNLKMIFSGAAPLGEKVSRAYMERLGVGIRQ